VLLEWVTVGPVRSEIAGGTWWTALEGPWADSRRTAQLLKWTSQSTALHLTLQLDLEYFAGPRAFPAYSSRWRSTSHSGNDEDERHSARDVLNVKPAAGRDDRDRHGAKVVSALAPARYCGERSRSRRIAYYLGQCCGSSFRPGRSPEVRPRSRMQGGDRRRAPRARD
jgi:hypothetical protein